MKFIRLLANISLIIGLFYSTSINAQNTTISSFSQAKKILKNDIYFDYHKTFYCKATFNNDNKITLPTGFYTEKHKKRAYRLEWEHIVPAENFGRNFIEWREGHPSCIDSKRKAFKGRKCAEKTNKEFRYMLSDMYNLYPSIGAVNAMRSNYNFAELYQNIPFTFGACSMKIDNRKVEPPSYTKGAIARTYLYFEQEYPIYKMSSSMKKMMIAWNKMYPVDEWECKRAKRIEKLQGNANNFVKNACKEQNLY